MTFSIVGSDPDSGHLGVAVSTAMSHVGGRCVYVKAGVGAAATQGRTNPYLGVYALDLLAQGRTAEDALGTVLGWDPERAYRQVHLVDAMGQSAAFTGPEAQPWCGHLTDENFSVAGNSLTGFEVLDAMASAFKAVKGPLADRLIAALEAGQEAGGDRRGRASAALLVAGKEDYVQIRLHVEQHLEPVAELRRVYDDLLAHYPQGLRIPRSFMRGSPEGGGVDKRPARLNDSAR